MDFLFNSNTVRLPHGEFLTTDILIYKKSTVEL
jgi:hypothetical protein